MTVAVNTSVAAAFDGEGHERDQKRPHEEHVYVDQRNAGDLDRTREQGEQRIVEQECAEQEQRDQALSFKSRAHDGLRRGSAPPQSGKRLPNDITSAACVDSPVASPETAA